jgi:AmmeMemoRadiSam system protein B
MEAFMSNKKKLSAVMLLSFIFLAAMNGTSHEKKTRAFHSDYGFAVNRQQLESVIKTACSREAADIANTEKILGAAAESGLAAAICPHDDYSYAGQVYAHVMPYVKAKRVIIFGVAHKAKDFDLRDKLIFGSFDEWDTAAGPLRVSGLEEYLIGHLKSDEYTVSNPFMEQEHSIEALTHWLKYYNPDAEIIPICVPHMKWERMQELAKSLSATLAAKIKSDGWKAGSDYAILISNDSSHYGDQDWGGKNYAPFGCGVKGYLEATGRDIKLAGDYLSGQLTSDKLHKLSAALVDENDPYTYLITWCGRFSIPFGLSVLANVSESLGGQPFSGVFLSYGTSIALGLMDEGIEPPLQTTAPSNLHHWVGYLAMGFK